MRTRRLTPTRTMVALLTGVALLAAACGNDDEEPAATDPPSTEPVGTTPDFEEVDEPPSTDATDSTEAVVADPMDGLPVDEEPPEAMDDVVPERIVSLSPTHTEMLFAIGAGDQLVAVDDFSDYPPEALELPNELSGFEPNVEAIAAFEPDLVVTGGDFTGLGDQLAELEIAAWDGPAAETLDDTYRQIEELGAITGHAGEAARLVGQMQLDVSEIVATTPRAEVPLTFYHELDPTFFSADSTTFIGEIYALLGLQNIADQAEGESFGFPQLNAEFIVSADPDVIFLADTKCCAETAETVSQRPGWDAIVAVQNGAVIEMDDDIASRWGPRIVDYLADVADALTAVAGEPAG
ncbi:MAG: helical backbone metal receptor [Ilumatobacteraceae bacterium]